MLSFVLFMVPAPWLLVPAAVAAAVSHPQDLEAFTDELMQRSMNEHHVPGAVVSIVRDGRIALMKGYGYADLERQAAANPYRTVFRLGSISKSVTATAVMQLYEEGLIDLHQDIRSYWPDVRLPDIVGQPVTLHHLLTHTAGLCESVFAVGRDRERQLPLSAALTRYLPSQCRKPGVQIAYSNQGMSLAGYLVESKLSVPYEQAVQARIFQPLNMNRSGFRLQESDPELAKSYSYENGAYSPLPYSYIHHLPAGALQSTAEDIAHYMLAHLQHGRYGETRILQAETAALMHRTQFAAHTRMPGMAYGFYERYQNGLRLIEHDGSIDGFESYLYLIPSENTGIFIATNASGGAEVRERLIDGYLDRFYPVRQAAAYDAKPASVRELKQVDGYYLPNRSRLKGPLNLGQHLSAVRVQAVEDGVITMRGERYRQTEPGLFRHERSQEAIYVNAVQGTLALSSIPTMMYERERSALYHPYLHIAIVLGLALVYPLQAVCAVPAWLVGLIRRRRPSFDWLGTLVSVLFVVYFLFVVSLPELLINEIPGWIYPVLYAPFLLLVVLAVRVAGNFVRKRPVAKLQVGAAISTAIFVAYLYAWDFFRLI
ncbi:serine hydrolase domain-containing protein [Paenibacillus chartarius]|uniref:Serine hydrolase domain-containing protein n=1 Tax=Paenibacillus chartarius TaxID=747481 RepID=A0ABV6DEC8_9BACL